MLYLILALAAFTALPFLAIRWLDTPFTHAFLSAYATGLIFLITSLWALRVRLQDPAARAFAVFSSSAGLGLATLFDLTATGRLVPLWTISIAVGGAALLNLALLFPQESRLVSRLPSLRWLGYPLAGLLVVNTLTASPFLPPTAVRGGQLGVRNPFRPERDDLLSWTDCMAPLYIPFSGRPRPGALHPMGRLAGFWSADRRAGHICLATLHRV